MQSRCNKFAVQWTYEQLDADPKQDVRYTLIGVFVPLIGTVVIAMGLIWQVQRVSSIAQAARLAK